MSEGLNETDPTRPSVQVIYVQRPADDDDPTAPPVLDVAAVVVGPASWVTELLTGVVRPDRSDLVVLESMVGPGATDEQVGAFVDAVFTGGPVEGKVAGRSRRFVHGPTTVYAVHPAEMGTGMALAAFAREAARFALLNWVAKMRAAELARQAEEIEADKRERARLGRAYAHLVESLIHELGPGWTMTAVNNDSVSELRHEGGAWIHVYCRGLIDADYAAWALIADVLKKSVAAGATGQLAIEVDAEHDAERNTKKLVRIRVVAVDDADPDYDTDERE